MKLMNKLKIKGRNRILKIIEIARINKNQQKSKTIESDTIENYLLTTESLEYYLID